MSQDLLNIGDFAKMAETTKRTVLWYEEKGILKPKQVDTENGYRLYAIDQIIDFKAILLLRKLDFSIEEIRSFLAKQHTPEALFNLKKKALQQEIADLQTVLRDTDKYYRNLQKTGTLVDPRIKTFKSFPVFYIDKLGPYYQIDDYFTQLRSCFDFIPPTVKGLVLYEGVGYQPKNVKTKICFWIRPGLKLKPEAKDVVKKMTVPGFRALAYTHYGSSRLLSMLWVELKKYQVKNDYKADQSLPFEDAELSESAHVTEMLMPIK